MDSSSSTDPPPSIMFGRATRRLFFSKYVARSRHSAVISFSKACALDKCACLKSRHFTTSTIIRDDGLAYRDALAQIRLERHILCGEADISASLYIDRDACPRNGSLRGGA